MLSLSLVDPSRWSRFGQLRVESQMLQTLPSNIKMRKIARTAKTEIKVFMASHCADVCEHPGCDDDENEEEQQ